MKDPCAHCEDVLQPYLDRDLTERERFEAERHLDECDGCRKRYRFEATLRRYVRDQVSEPISAELRARLLALRTPLV